MLWMALCTFEMRPVMMSVPLKRSMKPISTFEAFVAMSAAMTEISAGVIERMPMAAWS